MKSILLLMSFIISATLGIFDRGHKLSENVTFLLENLLSKTKYDRQLRPGFGGVPVVIDVNMRVRSLGPVSERDQTYSLDCYFRQLWMDPRLKFNTSDAELQELHMNWQFLDMVWKPDTFFLNGLDSHLHKITVPNRFIRIRSDGRLIYSMRLTIKARCRMSLMKFPLDTQTCPLEIGSYGYTAADVKYQWDPLKVKKVDLEEGLNLAQYELVNVTYLSLDRNINNIDAISVLAIEFAFQRHTGYFLLQVYIPCGLIVSCSWVSFWIDQEAVPARVALGVTTALTMTTIGFGQNRSGLPQVSYATALDWFVIMCFAFIFASMVEFASINYIEHTGKIKMMKRYTEFIKKMQEDIERKRPRNKPEDCDEMFCTTASEVLASTTANFYGFGSATIDAFPVARNCRCSSFRKPITANIPEENDKFSMIDIYARKLFPLTFTCLNLLYFVTYVYFLSDEIPLIVANYTSHRSV